MVEVIEYTLVVLVSALFVAGSVTTYDSFSSYESGLNAKAEFSAITAMASLAVENGTSTGTIVLPRSSLSCASGTLSFTSGSVTLSASLGVPCGFAYALDNGAHRLDFAMKESSLSLEVT
jgi:hypothetical protein